MGKSGEVRPESLELLLSIADCGTTMIAGAQSLYGRPMESGRKGVVRIDADGIKGVPLEAVGKCLGIVAFKVLQECHEGPWAE